MDAEGAMENRLEVGQLRSSAEYELRDAEMKPKLL